MSNWRLIAVLLAGVLLILSVIGSAKYDLRRGQTPAEWAASTTTAALIPLNTATAAELMKLDGMTADIAEAIVTYRENIGLFSSVDDLRDITGITYAQWEQWAPHLCLS